MTSLAVIGTGLMGRALATCWARRGHSVTVWNRTRAHAAALEGAGILVAHDLDAAIGVADLLFVIVANYDIATAILEPLRAQLRGKSVVSGMTGTAAEARAMADAMRAAGALYLDAGIMCYPADIGTAHGLISYGGDEAAWLAHRQILVELAGKSTYLGSAPGLPNITDAAMAGAFYNVALGAFLEAAAFGTRAGLSAATLTPIAIHMMELLARVLCEEAVPAIDQNRYGTDQATLDVYIEAVRHWRCEMLQAGQRATLMTANLHNLEIAQAAGHGKESIYTQFLTANANPRAGKPE
ncbi:MAG: NAD(P)-dependent oxidoreductase [Proteobacteria bacterium]|nr:NAD(P)-dependent oxidoreductase [Pseudomonadota bacterium]